MTLYRGQHGRRSAVSRRELLLLEMLRAGAGGVRTDRTISLEAGKPHPRRTTPDAYFGAARVAVFHDGCYWHECPEHYPNRLGGKVAERISVHNELLARRGWLVLRIWEHEPDLRGFADRVLEVVRLRGRRV
jgi:hypothetical protein